MSQSTSPSSVASSHGTSGCVGLHHATLEYPLGESEQACTSYEQQARQFYGTLLHLEEIDIPSVFRAVNHDTDGIWFSFADGGGYQQLHLGPVKNFQAKPRGHIAVQVHHLEEMLAVLRASGVVIQEAIQEPGWLRCYIFDPFGNKLELREQC